VNDFVSIPNSASLALGSTGTISAWVKLNALKRWHTVVAKATGTPWESANYTLTISNTN
jgi:hypothetical protein